MLVILSIFVIEVTNAEIVKPGALLTALPEGSVKMTRENTVWLVQYCPDNTCDLLEISTSVNEQDVQRLALGFFVYYSSYLYLKIWQENARRDEAIQKEIHYLTNEMCPAQSVKQLVDCRFRELMATRKLAVFYVRFDEGERAAIRLRLDDVLR